MFDFAHDFDHAHANEAMLHDNLRMQGNAATTTARGASRFAPVNQLLDDILKDDRLQSA